MIDYKTVIVTAENAAEYPGYRVGDQINIRVPWSIEYFFSEEGQRRSLARALDLAHSVLDRTDDWLDAPCQVCGKRIGDHKAMVGWIGKGCPDSPNNTQAP